MSMFFVLLLVVSSFECHEHVCVRLVKKIILESPVEVSRAFSDSSIEWSTEITYAPRNNFLLQIPDL